MKTISRRLARFVARFDAVESVLLCAAEFESESTPPIEPALPCCAQDASVRVRTERDFVGDIIVCGVDAAPEAGTMFGYSVVSNVPASKFFTNAATVGKNRKRSHSLSRSYTLGRALFD